MFYLLKVKIDYINETLDKKYLGVEGSGSDNALESNETLLNNLRSITSATAAAASSTQPIESLKTKEEIYNYYEQLEENLKQVRGEIDKLKEEAYNDLVYINQILSTPSEEETNDDAAIAEPSSSPRRVELDIDQVYLRNDEEDEEDDNEDDEDYNDGIKAVTANSRGTTGLASLKDTNNDDDEETQYLSQPVSSQQADSSQVYMTPAESWQTLQNNKHQASVKSGGVVRQPLQQHELNQSKNNNDDEHTLKSDNQKLSSRGDDDENDETDLDQDVMNNEETESDESSRVAAAVAAAETRMSFKLATSNNNPSYRVPPLPPPTTLNEFKRIGKKRKLLNHLFYHFFYFSLKFEKKNNFLKSHT